MPALRAVATAALAAATLWTAPGAAAAKERTIDKSPRLWATVNICDTTHHPNTVGLRASMPGSGKRGERMYLRFQLQYFKTSTQSWDYLGPSGDSGFVSLGSAKYTRRETGRNFMMAPPKTGVSFRVRGVVTYEWRKGDKVVRHVRKRTRTRKGNVTGADPKGFSAAECTITAP